MKPENTQQAIILMSSLEAGDVISIDAGNGKEYFQTLAKYENCPLPVQKIEMVNGEIVTSLLIYFLPKTLVGNEVIVKPNKSEYLKGYPSQYEAELVLEAMNALQNIHTGYAHSANATNIIQKALDDLRLEFNRIFSTPATSPWIVSTEGGKRSAEWRFDW